MGIGILEVGLVLVLTIASLLATFFHHPAKRVLIALTVCMAIASVVTLADIFSCLLIGTLLFAAFVAGGRWPSSTSLARMTGPGGSLVRTLGD